MKETSHTGEPGAIAVIILNWNGIEDTLECLESVSGIEFENFFVLVVDNGSTDDSCARIKEEYPEVILIENDVNLGFAGGNNVGIRYALANGAEYIFLLNNDTVVDPRILTRLLSASHICGDNGIFGPKIYHHAEPDLVWYGGTRWDASSLTFDHNAFGDMENICSTAYVCGCALFIPASVVVRLGWMDIRYFLIFEDVEWCYRARLLGIESYFVPAATVWHKVSSSFGGALSPMAVYYHARNFLLWGERHLDCRTYVRAVKLVVNWATGFTRDQSAYCSRWDHGVHILSRLIRHHKGNECDQELHACYQGLRDYLLRRFGSNLRFSGEASVRWTGR